MLHEILPISGIDSLCVSTVLKRTLSNVTPVAVAYLDEGQNGRMVGTLPSTPASVNAHAALASGARDIGKPVSFAATPLGPEEIRRLDGYAGTGDQSRVWLAFRCRFDSGRVDRVAVRVQPGADETQLLGFLSLIWPVLREDCLTEIAGNDGGIADEALLWMITKKMDVAVFVVNQDGMILRSNKAAKGVLDFGRVLKRTRNGIACSDDVQTRHLREAIATCAAAEPDHSDAVIFLSSDQPGESVPKVPLTMCRFMFAGAPTSLVTMMLPSPPDSRRIEILARELGLTQAEARVAALLQLGLSNREAAEAAGLTEHTMNTYTKRVLHKFNVNSRAEIAQLLTWQGQGGPLS